MGFLGGMIKKKADPFDALREKADANPNDARASHDVAAQLHAKGLHGAAVDYAIKAANAHYTQGFAARALAELKSALAWGHPTAALLRQLADLHLELEHKEDARSTLIQLKRLLQTEGKSSELGPIETQLAELGPGR